MAENKSREDRILLLWRKTSLGRLYLELGGLSFALKKGFSPEEYAFHLWRKGAKIWMKNPSPTAGEYLLKEAEAFRCFYPEVVFNILKTDEDRAELIFIKGCLGGWGEDPWRHARHLGLTKENVCAYCHESFSIWAKQLNLKVHIGPQRNQICRLQVIKGGEESDLSKNKRKNSKERR